MPQRGAPMILYRNQTAGGSPRDRCTGLGPVPMTWVFMPMLVDEPATSDVASVGHAGRARRRHAVHDAARRLHGQRIRSAEPEGPPCPGGNKPRMTATLIVPTGPNLHGRITDTADLGDGRYGCPEAPAALACSTSLKKRLGTRSFSPGIGMTCHIPEG